jgi:cytochrome c553
MTFRALIAIFFVCAVTASVSAQSVSGDAVYQRRCAACHERPADGRTPSVNTLKAMTSSRILRTLNFGAMMTIAYQLRNDEREAVATYLGKPGGDAPPAAAAFCRDRSVTLDAGIAPAWNGWSPSRDNARFAPAALAGLTAAQVPQLKLKWAFGFDGDISAFSQPTVIGNQVFIGSAGGVVHALRADSGCLQWTFQANGPIRSAIVATPSDGKQVLLFGDLTGWFYALDASNGQLVWRKRPDDHEACARERAARRARRHRVCGRRLVGRITIAQSGVSVLHVPGQPRRHARSRRQRCLEDAHDPDSAGVNWQDLGRHAHLRSIGRRRVGRADARPETAQAVHHHRQQLLNAGDDDERFDHGARSRHRTHRLVEAGAAERRLQLGVLDDARWCDVSAGERSRLRLSDRRPSS